MGKNYDRPEPAISVLVAKNRPIVLFCGNSSVNPKKTNTKAHSRRTSRGWVFFLLDKQQQLAVLLKYGNERKHSGFDGFPGVWQRSKTLREAPEWIATFPLLSCRKTFTEPHKPAFHVADYLKDPRGLMAIRMLVEGCSIRTVERLTEIRRDSIIDLLLIAGQRCEKLMDSLHDIPVTDVQADECWNFIYCKEKNKGPIGMQLAYLFAAMAGGSHVALNRHSALVRLLRQQAVPTSDPI